MNSAGVTAWEAFRMNENNIKAVIGDVTMNLSQSSAAVSSLWNVPQCTPALGPITASFPYLFRTTSTIAGHGGALAQWVKQMGWQRFSVMYTDTDLGEKIYSIIEDQAEAEGMTIVNRLPILRPDPVSIIASLTNLKNSGSRIVILLASRTYLLRAVMFHAKKMGLFSEGWVWMLADETALTIEPSIGLNDSSYNGLMYMSNLWNLTGEREYDDLHRTWVKQPVPAAFSDPSKWNSTGLYYGATQSYSCLELFAHGINKLLSKYPGGRSKGLMDIAQNTFDTTEMRSPFFNFGYIGPAGYMNFSSTGDLQDGHFKVSYLVNGVSIPYAKVNATSFGLLSNDSIIYLGNSTMMPADIASQRYLNPTVRSASGIIIMITCFSGILVCFIIGALILKFRHLKPIAIASPVYCYLQLLGLIMCYISLLLIIGKPTPASCIVRQFTLPMGFVFVLGSIIAKNFRIYKIYQNVFTVRTSRLRASYLLKVVGIFQIFVIVPFIVWNSLYTINIKSFQIDSKSFCYYCQYQYSLNGEDGQFDLAQLFVIIWIFILVIVAALLAFKTRSVSNKWTETRQAAYVSYNLGVSAIVLIPSIMLTFQNYVVFLCLNIVAILFGTTFTLVVAFIPKFMFIFRHVYQNSNRPNAYAMDSQSQTNIVSTPMSQLDQIIEEMNDYTSKVHEGVVPVKKVAKLNFFSIWELKRVLLVPFQKYFILSENSGKNAILYTYTSCEVVPSVKKDHQIFRVFTDEGICFLFQVYDHESLERWVEWFNKEYEQDSPEVSLPKPTQAPGRMPKDDRITFGQVSPEGLYSETRSLQGADSPTCSLPYSSRYTTQKSYNTNSPTEESRNSFGVQGSAWQRYPK